MTLAVPITTSPAEVFAGIDQFGLATLLAKKGKFEFVHGLNLSYIIAVERSLTSKIEDAREALIYKLGEIIAVHKHAFAGSAGGGQLMVTENLKLLPVLILGLIKNVIFLLIRWVLTVIDCFSIWKYDS